MKKKKLKKKLHSLKERLQTNEYNEKILWEMLKKLIDKNGWSLADLLPEDGLDGLENICRPMMYIRCTQQSKKIEPYKPYGAYKSIMGKSDNSGVAFSSCIDGEQKGIEEHIRKRHHMMETDRDRLASANRIMEVQCSDGYEDEEKEIGKEDPQPE